MYKMEFGLNTTIVNKIKQVFEQNSKIDKAFIFGSRAKGNYKDGSDIDIAIKGNNLTFKDILTCTSKLEDLNIPYKIDLLDYHKIKEPALKEHIDRVGIEFYSSWKEYNLNEVYVFASGLSKGAAEFGFGYGFLGFTDIFKNFFVPNQLTSLVNSTEKEQQSCSIKRGDVFLTRTSETDEDLGMSCVALKDYPKATFNGFTKRLRPKGDVEILPEYAGFYFRSPKFRGTVSGMSSITTRASLNNGMLEQLTIIAPQIKEQKSIADTLISLHNKIDLLHRQNKTLEQLAETLFRQWFVVEAEESWEKGKLGNIAVIQNGYAFSSKNYVLFQEGFLEVLKMGHISADGGLRTNPKKDFVPREEKLKKWILNKNDIVMAMTDMKDNVVILGVPAMIDKNDKYVLNQRVARISLQTNDKLINSYLLYMQLRNSDFIATLQSKANSGVQVNLSTEAIKDCIIVVPPLKLQNEKGKIITDLYLKKENNDIQINALTKLRDTLLPKLMSGEVRVEM